MSIRIIIGRAGTGKTKYCMDSFKAQLQNQPKGPSLILLVPEQATFQMEQSLLNNGINGMISGQVLSFRRLAHRVLEEYGGIKHPFLNDVGKNVILQSIIQKRQNRLEMFNRSAVKPGFINRLNSLLSELRAYNVNPGDFEELTDGFDKEIGNERIRRKLKDIDNVYSGIVEYTDGRYIDPDDYLSLLSSYIKHSNFLKGSKIWIDGFAGFTLQEYNVIRELINTVSRVEITLCLDSSWIDGGKAEGTLFKDTFDTYNKLLMLAEQERVSIEKINILDKEAPGAPVRYKNNPEIRHLEAELYNYSQNTYSDILEKINLSSAANHRTEVEGTVREITRLSRDYGYRYREMSVIVRNIEPYEELIKEIFSDFDIPYFIDKKWVAGAHPLIELIRSALNIVISEWASESVVNFLKTDLTPIDRENIDLMENYVLAKGISGRDCWINTNWKENSVSATAREKTMNSLDKFYQTASQAEKVTDISHGLIELLEELDVSQSLDRMRQEAADAHRFHETQEHSQVWNGLIDMLDQIVYNVGEENVSVGDFAEMLEAGFDALDLRLIPPGMDQVLVASIERSRHPPVKASFILGLNEGEFPAKIKEEVILDDQERNFLEESGISLAPTSREQLFQEQFFVYIALTRPSRFLWLSYSLSTEDGKVLFPSEVVDQIKTLFPQIEEKTIKSSYHNLAFSIEDISTQTELTKILVKKLRKSSFQEMDSLTIEAIRWFYSNPERWNKVKHIFESPYYENDEKSISTDIARRLYGENLNISVSGLEKFAACPFAHFLDKGLRLKQREEFLLLPPHIGLFYHAALKCFLERLLASDIKFEDSETARDHAQRIIREAAEDLISGINKGIMQSSPSYTQKGKQISRTLEKAADVLYMHLLNSSFRPFKLEVPFGTGESESLSPLKLEFYPGKFLVFRGRIDRIDSAEYENKIYVRVIDYKSSFRSLSLSDLYEGTDLQLMAYLTVAVKKSKELFGEQALPAGALYFTVYDPLITKNAPVDENEAARDVRKKLKMSGLLLSDEKVLRLMDNVSKRHSNIIPVEFTKQGIGRKSRVVDLQEFYLLMDYTLEKMRSLARGIINGNVSISPTNNGAETACDKIYCDFKSICGFDTLLGNTYKHVLREDDRSVLDRIKKRLGER